MAGEHEIQLAGADPFRRTARGGRRDRGRPAHRGQVLAIPRRQRDLSHQRGGRRCRGCGRRRNSRAPALRRPVPRAKRRPVRHHVRRASPRVELPARAARRFHPPRSLQTLLPLIAWRDVEWSGRSVRLPRAGMEIDFGGIGKEYAADRAATILLGHGMRHGFVNLGGDIRAIGPQPDGTPWRAGIRHPRVAECGDRSVRSRGRRAGHERRLRALFRPRRQALLPHPRSADGHAGDALAIGERDGAAVRGRRQLRHDRDVARRRRAVVPRRARSCVAWRRRRRNDLSSIGGIGALRIRRQGGEHIVTPIPKPSAIQVFAIISSRTALSIVNRWLGAPSLPLL